MTLDIRHVRLAVHDDGHLSGKLCTVRCKDGRVLEVQSESGQEGNVGDIVYVDGKGGLLIPSLCHSHIHLDKCHILDKGAPLLTGDFAEALHVTSDIKSTFPNQTDDLYARGNKLIHASLEAGVTSMRAHVEVDKTVNDTCLSIGVRLKETWRGICDVQLSLFMQDPIFDGPEDGLPGTNGSIAREAVKKYSESLGSVGSAPYVESTKEQQRANIQFILDLAIQYDKHVDFHLDYDLCPLPTDPECDSAPLIYHLLAKLHELHWTDRMPRRRITIGHATRLSLFSPSQLSDLCTRIGSLPVHLVGLPQSDVYMMGRNSDSGTSTAVRGTLNVCKLAREYGLSMAMAVNNVGNAFTPQGTPDPMMLCPLGVAIYQDGTVDGCRRLLEAITTTSKSAIGFSTSEGDGFLSRLRSLEPSVGSPADFVILHDNHSVQSSVLDPSYDRTTIKGGVVVARRTSSRWVSMNDLEVR